MTSSNRRPSSPRAANRRVNTSLRLRAGTLVELKLLAARKGYSIQALLERLVERYLDKKRGKIRDLAAEAAAEAPAKAARSRGTPSRRKPRGAGTGKTPA
jgi:hypothetical protein